MPGKVLPFRREWTMPVRKGASREPTEPPAPRIPRTGRRRTKLTHGISFKVTERLRSEWERYLLEQDAEQNWTLRYLMEYAIRRELQLPEPEED